MGPVMRRQQVGYGAVGEGEGPTTSMVPSPAYLDQADCWLVAGCKPRWHYLGAGASVGGTCVGSAGHSSGKRAWTLLGSGTWSWRPTCAKFVGCGAELRLVVRWAELEGASRPGALVLVARSFLSLHRSAGRVTPDDSPAVWAALEVGSRALALVQWKDGDLAAGATWGGAWGVAGCHGAFGPPGLCSESPAYRQPFCLCPSLDGARAVALGPVGKAGVWGLTQDWQEAVCPGHQVRPQTRHTCGTLWLADSGIEVNKGTFQARAATDMGRVSLPGGSHTPTRVRLSPPPPPPCSFSKAALGGHFSGSGTSSVPTQTPGPALGIALFHGLGEGSSTRSSACRSAPGAAGQTLNPGAQPRSRGAAASSQDKAGPGMGPVGGHKR